MTTIQSEGIETGDPERPFVARIRIGNEIHKEWPAESLEKAKEEADAWLRDMAKRSGLPDDRVLPDE